MAVSDKKHRKPSQHRGPTPLTPVYDPCYCGTILPSTTPGALGIHDCADPNSASLLGDTPGSLGMNDVGTAPALTLPGLKTLHNWGEQAAIHLPPDQQIASFFPRGGKGEVLEKAYDFILAHEASARNPPVNPIVPGASSGVTIGVGYDLGQHSREQILRDWAQLNAIQPLGGSPNLQRHPLSPLERLARAARMSHGASLAYLAEVRDIRIPEALSINVFRDSMLPEMYEQAVAAYSGVGDLPTGVQVAFLDLVFNRGLQIYCRDDEKRGKVAQVKGDIFNRAWEMQQLKSAILLKDLLWIYWYFDSMRRRLWNPADRQITGVINRRADEMQLILPYVKADLDFEASLRKHPSMR